MATLPYLFRLDIKISDPRLAQKTLSIASCEATAMFGEKNWNDAWSSPSKVVMLQYWLKSLDTYDTMGYTQTHAFPPQSPSLGNTLIFS